MLEVALQHAREGFPVFPCVPRDKDPLIPKEQGGAGFHDATTDEAKIRAWWSWCPDANVGIAVPPGYVVLDVDPRNGGDMSLLPAAGPTRIAASGRGDGGRHIWFQIDPELTLPGKLPKDVFGPGIDVKLGGRGYVMAPGSIHPDTGKPYTWVDRSPIAPLPAEILKFTRPRGQTLSAEDVAAQLEQEDLTQSPEAIAEVAKLIAPHYVKGQKHDLAKNLGGWLKQRGWSPADVAAVIAQLPSDDPRARIAAAQAAFRIAQPFGWEELQTILSKPYASAMDHLVPNPRREREKRDEEAVRAVLEKHAPPMAVPPTPTAPGGITARLLALKAEGPPIPTRVEVVDKALRGGLRDGKGVIVGGAPGAGKTSWICQWAANIAHDGVAVGWFAADEEPIGIDVRRMQHIGISRDDAEAPNEQTIARVQTALEALPFVMYDPADGWTLDIAVADFAARFPNQRRVFCLDSIQTANTARSANLEPRARIDDVIATMKNLSRAEATKCAWVGTSELARGAYRSEKNSDAINDMAAFKESGGIEYQGHVLYVLRSLQDDVIAVANPKNRVGPKIDSLQELNRETMLFRQVFDDPREKVREEAAQRAAEDVIAKIRTFPYPGVTAQKLKAVCGFRAQVVSDAIQVLSKSNRIVGFLGPRNAMYWRDVNLVPPTMEPEFVPYGEKP